ncbi:MAG: DNA recombination/repair protein RecA, partial [Erysipelothrix sp.]|nr:DNA recombination/repair protein RecA [Erysipelothrix sp.]
GISTVGEVVDLAAEHDVIQKSGAWYSYNQERIGQGRETVKEFFKENKDIYEEVLAKLKKIVFNPETEETK